MHNNQNTTTNRKHIILFNKSRQYNTLHCFITLLIAVHRMDKKVTPVNYQ